MLSLLFSSSAERETEREREKERERDRGEWGGVGVPQWNNRDRIIDTFYISIPFQQGCRAIGFQGKLK